MRYNNPFPKGVILPKVEFKKNELARFQIDPKSSSEQILLELCEYNLKDKLERELLIIDRYNNGEYVDRMNMELEILNRLGFTDYILLNWQVLNFCFENKIPTGAGRGSAAGSLILYLLGVTNIDPIKYDLYFERFVSESRARRIEYDGVTYLDGSLLADIDNDISYDRRREVIQFIEEEYKGRTSKILTLNTLSSKLCIKECMKIVSNLPEVTVNRISNTIPKKFGKVAKLSVAYEESDEFKKHADKHEKAFKIAKKIEGLIKNTGVHPSGIAICSEEQTNIMPVQKAYSSKEDRDVLVSGYDMDDVASLSVKFDILGVRSLSVVNHVCEATGEKYEKIDPRDERVYKVLGRGLEYKRGLFHIEADVAGAVCKDVKPRSLEELSAVVAIARPGASGFKDDYIRYLEQKRREGDEFTNFESDSIHPYFKSVLEYTGGIPLYQEQLMKMANMLGFSLDEAEQIRRIVGKKKVEKMAEWKDKISDKVKERGLDEEVGEFLWKVAEDSANYSFNKSHSISYSCLSAVTVYLKDKYPQQFYTSLLSFTKHEPETYEEIYAITQELLSLGIKLLPPDLLKSDDNFKMEGKNIRYGLDSIKGISEKSLELLMKFRELGLKNKYDVFMGAKQSGLNIGLVSSLIQAGVLDSFIDDANHRCRFMLEAQVFNCLTDREKRNFIKIGEKYNYDILTSIVEANKQGLMADDNKKMFRESRYENLLESMNNYKQIYLNNSKAKRYANWYFEQKILGYSYSCNIREVIHNSEDYHCSDTIKKRAERSPIRFVGTLMDVVARESQNGNKYVSLEINDEKGSIKGLLMDTRRQLKLTEYLNSGRVIPTKGEVIEIRGVKGDGIIFVNDIRSFKDKIYMKLSHVKKKCNK